MEPEKRIGMVRLSLIGHSFFYAVLFICCQGNGILAWGEEGLRPFIDDAGLFDPRKGPAEVQFQLFKDSSRVEIRVRDFRGQIVGNYNLIEMRAGDHSFTWDGKDADGKDLPDGRYELLFRAEFTDGSEAGAVVDIRIAAVAPAEAGAAPEPLPPKEYRHRVQGSVSTFWRHNGYMDRARDSGEARLITDFSFREESRRARGVLSVLQPFYSGSTSFNGSRALIEQDWKGGKAKGVFREGLGNFDDPMKLFSDFQSERKKSGIHLDHTVGEFFARGLLFGTEGDVDSREQGAAVRIKQGNRNRGHFGVSYTYREAMAPAAHNVRYWNHAVSGDLRLPMTPELALVVEGAHTNDEEKKADNGYVTTAQYDQGNFRFSGGYIDLGETFTAPFADPLHHVSSNARGVETSIDCSMATPLGYFNNPSVTLGYFNLKRHSDDQRLQEIDASMRFGIGRKDTFFLSWFGQEEGSSNNQTLRGNAEHRWNESWSSRLQGNHTFSDLNRSWRVTLDTNCRRKTDSTRLSTEWIRREVDTSWLSPFEEINLRFDWYHERWGFQLQTRHSRNQTESGYNFFCRVEYKPIFLHRYRFLTYASAGNRAAFSFEEQVEFGLETRY